jgi:general secretion pathway protein G
MNMIELPQRRKPGSITNQAFTLVEILIVVVILGILAAIVVPQFANASSSAQSSSIKSSLQVIRSQIELYDAHHSSYPTLAQLSAAWNVLTQRTDVAGNVGTTDGVHVYGPYLKKMPMNPFENSSTVAATAAAGVGWVYDEATGRLYGVMPVAKANELVMDQVNTIRTY